MTLTQLSYAIAVADHRTFAAAAEACFVTQPTLSMQLQKLEDELGVPIFDRSVQPARPTPIGRKILEQARIAVAEANRVTELAREEANDVSGRLRLGAIPTLAPYLLPLFLRKVADAHPKLELVVEELQTQQIVDRIREGSLDVGLLVTPLRDPSIVEDPLFYEPFLVYASPRHALAEVSRVKEKDLALKDAWLLDEGHCFRDQAIRLCGEKKKRSPEVAANLRLESGNLETLKKLVDQGSGYTFLPWLAAMDVPASARKRQLKEFAAPVPTREVSLVHGRLYRRTAALAALRSEILSSIPKEIRDLKRDDARRIEMPRID